MRQPFVAKTYALGHTETLPARLSTAGGVTGWRCPFCITGHITPTTGSACSACTATVTGTGAKPTPTPDAT